MDEEIKIKIDELPKPKLIEDLGRIYPKEDSKQKTRFGLYECGFCGTHFKATIQDVKSGNTKSCGCYIKLRLSKSGKVHNGRGTRLYGIWKNIKDRTTNKNSNKYPNYGGRGITMCEEWLNDFVAFREWALLNGYSDELSIDRINNDGNYEPDNCRWTTRYIQARNQRIKGNNTSGYRGVSFNKVNNRFVACISVDNKYAYLGTFKTAIEGAIAYNNYIIENNLEGFILNVIPEQIKEKENDE